MTQDQAIEVYTRLQRGHTVRVRGDFEFTIHLKVSFGVPFYFIESATEKTNRGLWYDEAIAWFTRLELVPADPEPQS